MTPPAKAGGFSGDGTTCSEGVAVHRYRLKAPSEPLSLMQHVASGVQVPTDAQAAGTAMPAFAERLGDVRAAGRTVLRGTGWVHLDERPAGAYCLAGQDRDELAPARVVNGLRQYRASQRLEVQ